MRGWLTMVLLGCSALAGSACDLLSQTGSRADAKLFFSIGDPVIGGPPVGSFQDALDGWSYLFDVTDPSDPRYECQHNDAEMEIKATMHDIPLNETCIPPDEPRVDDPDAPPFEPSPPPPAMFPPTHEGLPGTNPLPPEQSTWRGAETGGCGVWSSAMCDRRLGTTDPTTQVVQGEWNAIADVIKLTPDGGSTAPNRAAYYRAQGYCVIDKRFDGTEEDYLEIADNLDTCDVKLHFYRRTATGYAFGHVETVTAAGARSVTTNSWGRPAAIEGGSAGGFGHWQDGKRWMEDDGDPTYPPDSTEVMVTFVCPCNHPMMETLGQTILRSIGGL